MCRGEGGTGRGGILVLLQVYGEEQKTRQTRQGEGPRKGPRKGQEENDVIYLYRSNFMEIIQWQMNLDPEKEHSFQTNPQVYVLINCGGISNVKEKVL